MIINEIKLNDWYDLNLLMNDPFVLGKVDVVDGDKFALGFYDLINAHNVSEYIQEKYSHIWYSFTEDSTILGEIIALTQNQQYH